MVKTYYMLTKPGIIIGNIITMACGFALASKGGFDFWLFVMTLVGLSLVIASAGVFNNYIDRAMDAKMARTKDRALVTGTISNEKALIFATILGLGGFFFLGFFTNLLTIGVAFTGFFVYLVLYAVLKYRSFYGTIVGSIAGAVPPVVGYTAVSNHLDLAALLLFLILVLWQMPHFFAIAIYRLNDYTKAKIPVLPVAKGVFITKIQMVLYIIAFMVTTCMLTITGYTGTFFLIITLLLSLSWLALSLYGFKVGKSGNQKWGHQMFALSLVVIMSLCATVPFDLAY